MSYLNANIPPTYAQIRKEYLYDLKKHHGEVEDCIIFGITSMGGRAILWHAIMENGAIFYRLPISAFIQRGFKVEDVPKRRLDELERSVPMQIAKAMGGEKNELFAFIKRKIIIVHDLAAHSFIIFGFAFITLQNPL